MNNKDESASKSAEEIAKKLFLAAIRRDSVLCNDERLYHARNMCNCDVIKLLSEAILETEKRGENRVLARLPSYSEYIFTLNSICINSNMPNYDFYKWLTARLKGEP